MGRCALLLTCTLCVARLFAQVASPPDEPVVPPGIPPDERVDVTGDGIADLLITGSKELIPDPEQGLDGWFRRRVETLPGTAILANSTRNNYGFYLLPESERIDTAALAKRFHFKQLRWMRHVEPITFNMLEQPFGPGIAEAAKGWFGTGEHHDGTMILLSTMGGHTRIAAFNLWTSHPAGRIGVTMKEAVTVPTGFGNEGDPPPPLPKKEDPYSFGHEPPEPQVIIPPGIPPDEAVDLDFDEVPDVIITGFKRTSSAVDTIGYFVRGVAPAPGVSFLMRVEKWGTGWGLFRLGDQEDLTPEQLTMGLQSNILRWASREDENVFCPVLQHPFGKPDEPQEWTYAHEEEKGDPVFRTMHYGQPVIGVVALNWYVPGGELSVDPQNWVEEGKVLRVR